MEYEMTNLQDAFDRHMADAENEIVNMLGTKEGLRELLLVRDHFAEVAKSNDAETRNLGWWAYLGIMAASKLAVDGIRLRAKRQIESN
jgi:hypothetical protein